MNGGYEPTNPLVSFQDGTRKERLIAAKQAAKDIIDGKYGHYELAGTISDPPSEMTEEIVMEYADNFFNIFNQKGAWNDEVIWGIQYLRSEGNTTAQNKWWGPNGYHNWGNNGPNEPVVRKFEMADGTPFIWDKYNPGNMYVRDFTAAQLEEDPEKILMWGANRDSMLPSYLMEQNGRNGQLMQQQLIRKDVYKQVTI